MSVTLTTTISSSMATKTAKLLKPVNQISDSKKLSDSQALNLTQPDSGSLLKRKAPIVDDDYNVSSAAEDEQEELDKDFKTEIVWRNIVLFIILHTCIPLGAYVFWTQRPWKTVIFGEYRVSWLTLLSNQ